MLTGTVTENLEPKVPLSVRGPGGASRTILAVLDTGFNGYLTLPPDLIAAIGLRFWGHVTATLADGWVVTSRRFVGEAGWQGKMRPALIDEAEGDCLLGMSLLLGNVVAMTVAPQGRIEVRPAE